MTISRTPYRPLSGSPSYSPDSLPAYRGGAVAVATPYQQQLFEAHGNPGGDWWRGTDTSKILQPGDIPVVAVNDPVFKWNGSINNIQLQQVTTGNLPKYGVNGVIFQFNVAARKLETVEAYGVNTPFTMWAKINTVASGNSSHIMGITNTPTTVALSGIGCIGSLYEQVRESPNTGFAAPSGYNKYILRYNGTSAQFYIDDDAPVTAPVGTSVESHSIAIGSSNAGDFTVLDFGYMFDDITDDEVAQLKLTLDELT